VTAVLGILRQALNTRVRLMRSNPVIISYPPSLLVSASANDLRQEVQDALTAGSKTFLIDFQTVQFMDNYGLGILITILKDVRSAEGQLFLCSLNEQVEMLLERAQVKQVFTVLSNQAEFQAQVLGE
jgi:anti-sigma B factor antagonist